MIATQPAAAGEKGRDADHLDAIYTLLRFVADGGLPTRKAAVDYLNHRSHLLASPISEMLPGFLYQCGTIDRFKDFIFLYDPDAGLRGEFVDRMIARARGFLRSKPAAARSPAPPPQPPTWDF